jgi:hypothetical protein
MKFASEMVVTIVRHANVVFSPPGILGRKLLIGDQSGGGMTLENTEDIGKVVKEVDKRTKLGKSEGG